MKFVLNASPLGIWDFATIAARAKEAGYDGVELGASSDDSRFTSANVLLSGVDKVRAIFDSAGVAIVALSSPMAIDPGSESFPEQMTGVLDACQQLGAGIVRIQHRGKSQNSSGSKLSRGFRAIFGRPNEVSSDQLRRAADAAASRKIRIVVENAPAASANEIWVLLERLEHPALGCSLNLSNLTLGGQSSYQVVPTLNQKIIYAEVGDGDVHVQEFLTRLLGIGYGGYVAVDLREPAAATEVARDSLMKLREWARPREAKQPGGRRTKAKAH